MPTLTTAQAGTVERKTRMGALAPSLSDFLFGALLAWLFLGGGGKLLLSDGDTGWHIRTGDWIWRNHAVPRQDLFTFTRPGEQWFAWEWLTDALFSWLHTGWGLKAVAAVAGVVVCVAATLLFCRMLWSGANLFLSLGLTLLANCSMMIHFLARPHVFTFLLLAASLWLLARDRRKPDGAIWLLAPITAIWVNLHGGFLALLVCLGVTAAGYGLQWLTGERRESLFFLKRYCLVGAACALATLINPYGYHLHQHIAGYLKSDFVLDTVEEFQSPKFRGENMAQFEVLLLAGLGFLGTLLARKKFVEAGLILFWAQATLTSVRHAPIFVIVVAPILAEELSRLWDGWSRDKSAASILGILRDLGAEFSGATLRLTIWGPALALLVWSSMARGADENLWPKDFPKQRFPVALIDQYKSLLAPETGAKPRIFTSDQWADYLTYRFYPGIKIFVDGRSDFFGPALGKEYVHLASARYDWEEILRRYRIDIALLPAEWPLAELLKRDPEWRLVQDDKLGILFEHRTAVLMKNQVSAESSTSKRSPR